MVSPLHPTSHVRLHLVHVAIRSCCVQVEVIMPATWSVKQSHDVALQLQHKVSRTHLA